MRRGLKYIYISILFFEFATAFYASAQEGANPVKTDEANVIVGTIFIIGNTKTRENFILREIPFKTGEHYSLAELVRQFEQARKQLLNTSLFTRVVVAAKDFSGQTIDIVVELKERNYIFPVPYFKPIDRNLNQWIVEKHASLNRINYGAKLYYNNLTGTNDKLRIGFSSGYTRQLSFSYDRLYFDKKLKWGLKFAFAVGKNHELNYNTVNDKQAFVKDERDYVRTFSNLSLQFTYRPAIKARHSLGIGYGTETISDTVLSLNSNYYNAGKKRIRFPGIYYNLLYYDLDYIPYPTKGYAFDFTIGKSGFDQQLNLWQTHFKGLACWPVSQKTFISTHVYAGIKLPLKQPYYSQRFLGYGDVYMQGYEYYVVDGSAGGYLKAALNTKLFDFDIKSPAGKKNNRVIHVPIGIYGRIFGNTGYVYNQDPGENTLSNKMLWSGGVGIDIITFYDVTVRLEWSFNSVGQNGLFLHRKTIF